MARVACAIRGIDVDPRVSLPIRSQDAPAAGRALSARPYGRLFAVLRRHACEAHRHWHPRPDRAPAAGGGLCADLHPGNVIMTADGPRLIDWTGAVAGPPPSTLGSATSSF